ncbi:hypothetical protein Goshw_025684, partial [Gossypium schwendimanii]|nr:hypothetical protein [Gossypium schwendimanii]
MEKGFLDKVEDNAADFTRISIIQNDLREMKEIWNQWDDDTKQLLHYNYGDLPYLFSVKVDKHLFRALAQFWNPAYNCFTFGKVDLVPTVEDLRDLVLVHPDVKKRFDVFALGIYGLVIFPKALGYIDEVVPDLFDRLSKGVTPVLAILAETFRS